MSIVRILVIDDEQQMLADMKKEIEYFFEDVSPMNVDVTVTPDFDDGLEKLKQGLFDIAILDVRREKGPGSAGDPTAGYEVFAKLKKVRFIPIIFWTAFKQDLNVSDMPPLVRVFDKNEIESVPSAILAAVQSEALSVTREIESRVSESLRNHMWTELAPNWSEYFSGSTGGDVSNVLISRTARVLDADRSSNFTSNPSHRYIYPPASETRGPGDILRESCEGGVNWWVILTPACDFESRGERGPNAERIVLAGASLLSNNPKFLAWREAKSNGKWNELRRDILGSTSNRYRYLPEFREIPDLVVDFQYLRSIEFDELKDFDVVSSIASPFAESFLAQHSHYAGRIGVPDLDIDEIQSRLSSS